MKKQETTMKRLCVSAGIVMLAAASALAVREDAAKGAAAPRQWGNTIGKDVFTSASVIVRDANEPGLKPGIQESHIKAGEGDLRFYVFAPKNYNPGKAYPVVFTFNGTLVGENSWMTTLAPVLEKYGYLCVNPNGQSREGVDALYAWIQKHAKIDKSRVYAMGSSRGGLFAIDLVLTTSYFAAVAPVAAMLREGRLKVDSPKIPVFQINGDQDQTVPYNGGKSHGASLLGALESVRIWAKHNGCGAEPVVDKSVKGFVLYKYPGGPGAPEAIQCTVLNTGHSVLRILPEQETTQLTEMVWQFFGRHAKNP